MSRLSINWVLPRPNLSGGIKSNRLIAEAMVRRGHDVRIVYDAQARRRPSLRQPVQWLRSVLREPVGATHLERSTARLIPVHRSPITASDVPDGDVTIGTWWETMEWVAAMPPSKGVKAYFIRHHELHGGPPDRVEATYRIPCLKLVIARWLQRLMSERYGDPGAVLVPNGVDWTQFDSPRRTKPAAPVVGMLYGVQAWKGAAAALDAMRRLSERVPDVRIVAFGRDPLRREHVPPRNFTYHLAPAQGRIPELYRSATCWLVPSRLEGFGMPGLEAAACRCPIVATRSGGPEDYVEDGVSGYLVPVDDSAAMADAMERIVTADPARWLEMSEASRRVAEAFDWDRSAEVLERALEDAVAKHRRGVGPAHPA